MEALPLRKMPVQKSIIVGAVILATCALAMLLWGATHPASALKVSVSFEGYTNTTSGAQLAIFKVTNCGRVRVRRWAEYDVGVKNEPQPRRPRHFGQDASLEPGQSDLYAVPAYTNQGDWRVMLYFSRADLRLRVIDAQSKFPPALLRLVPTSLQSVTSLPVWSDWISK